MATKQENRDTVAELIDQLGLELELPQVDDEGSKYWAKMVSDLKAKKRDKDNQTDADDAVEGKPQPEPKECKGAIVVAPGKSLTSRKGNLAPGTPVSPEFWTNGEEVIKHHLKTGHLVKE